MSVNFEPGDLAPDFEAKVGEGANLAKADFAGRALVLYFYPKDNTSGCTSEAIAFGALQPAFAEAGATILGVSPDSLKSHAKFRQKHGLGFDLAADESKTIAGAYGVWVEKSMYGRKYMGVDRATFLIGRDGRIARAWRKVKVPGHAEEVLAAVRAL